LDEHIGGGFVEGSSVMLVSDPHEAAELFLQHFIYEGLKNGERVVYCCFGVDAESLCESMKYYNMDPYRFLENKQLTIVDLHSGLRKTVNPLPNVSVINPQPIMNISIYLKKLYETQPITRGVCDTTATPPRLARSFQPLS
jgi:KaiC/GvpD/RAD55 family RecA-like ATPase